ncbi:MAG: TIGR02266 family protein [Deltaproteobacteria bacterium]|nr:TIGR02266 family protein [Deltaproteobacteria bacterium]MBW1934097.1 TIGR02266 family protein [Deltaproteobacteria bacterium]MBW1976842.1 TIGR02266 family protein [Deltaproteobacteria bacterium]MBW2043868.1 TIGR02266 family protein [Deltaproteobacteria bacterium]MBW2300041.1 TIGR02266 family protein [Deltaproteobacteria bacterium]
MFTLASEETYEDGQVIIKEGSAGDWVYVILSGAVEISRTIGGRRFVVERLQPGDTFGEIGFIGKVKRTATAVAVGKTTLGVIDREFLDEEFNKLSSDFRAIIVSMAKKFEKMTQRITEFSARQQERIQKSLSLTYKDDRAFLKAFTGNISSAGLFIRTEKPLPQGEKFMLKLQLPGVTEPLKINCEVAWSRSGGEAAGKYPPGMGVKFLEMSRKDKEALGEYLRQVKAGQ